MLAGGSSGEVRTLALVPSREVDTDTAVVAWPHSALIYVYLTESTLVAPGAEASESLTLLLTSAV